MMTEPFTKLPERDLVTLEKEGHALLTFAFPKDETAGVQVLPNR